MAFAASKLRARLILLFLAGLLGLLTGCHHGKQLWIYTSIYKEVIAEMEPKLKAALPPDVEIRWYQGGSENVAARINTELFAGRTQADLILTSDPFWYLELKKAGKLLAYNSPAAKALPSQYVDPDHAFATVRMPVMVMGYNPVALKTPPQSFKELANTPFKDRISMGSPLESGTNFMAVAMLSKAYGWDFFAQLRKQELIAAGGNSSVITRIETRERPIGIVLLENILKARHKGSPVTAIYPSDGAIAVPSPIAIAADTRQPELAQQAYDWFFSDEAQKAITHGWMYSPLEHIPAPAGALPWAELSKHLMPWNPAVLAELYEHREEVKSRFSEVILR